MGVSVFGDLVKRAAFRPVWHLRGTASKEAIPCFCWCQKANQRKTDMGLPPFPGFQKNQRWPESPGPEVSSRRAGGHRHQRGLALARAPRLTQTGYEPPSHPPKAKLFVGWLPLICWMKKRFQKVKSLNFDLPRGASEPSGGLVQSSLA